MGEGTKPELIEMAKTKIVDTFSECFNMWCARILITAIDKEIALAAAQSTVGFATSIIMCSAEAGIEQILSENETPDGRPGVVIQIWTRRSKQMKDELLTRISQCAMTAPTTSVFNYLESGEKSESIGKLIAYFGDGHQKKLQKYSRDIWEMPVMDGTFEIEETFHFTKGVAGGVILLVGSTTEETLAATRAAVNAIQQSSAKAITSFPAGICRAGSKIGSKYSFLNESTNHKFCPTLKEKIADSLLPKEANCVYEIVINGITEEEIRKAMKAVIQAVKDDERILKITSTNYEGELGSIQIPLKELL
ncbi:MAG: formylmethanofuran--tetrahydromethanopterin N-formyltransferase [Asgard group archaeon]|nr:formylmethanofuran--tetrahydromethanopterin N-formyltransferase [Asgard group archaeon]